ncbi:MAG TPA: hypothetical protein VJB11_01735 [archaeon]|nr:hypothetical protein [archaeon]
MNAMPSSDILEKYRKMQERFNLPHLNELKNCFKFDIEENEEIFDQIRNEISDRLFNFTEKIIEPLIAGSDSLCCVYEQEMITEEERVLLFGLYKRIQMLKWENNLLIIKPDESKNAEWIKKTWEMWNGDIEEKLISLCKKLSNNWKNLRFEEAETEYNG